MTQTKKCPECNGTGQLETLGGDWGKTMPSTVPCWMCKGTKVVAQ